MTAQTESKATLTLTGNRNQCTGCNEYFNHDHGFDRHRVGKQTGNQRRCLSVAEMVKKGFSKNAKGFWITEPQTAARVASARQGHSRTRPTEG
jgi:ribosomal protein L35